MEDAENYSENNKTAEFSKYATISYNLVSYVNHLGG